MEMTDQEFDKLERDLEEAMDLLDELQAVYREQTGKNYIRPVRCGA